MKHGTLLSLTIW